MNEGLYVNSTWFLLVPAMLGVVPAILFIGMPGRRLAVLAMTSVVFALLTAILWPLSYHGYMNAMVDTGQRKSDRFEMASYVLTVVNGNFEIHRNAVHYSGLRWQEKVENLPPYPQGGVAWITEPRFLEKKLLPKYASWRRVNPQWWGDYIDAYVMRRGTEVGLADGRWSVGFTGRIWFLFFPLSVFPAIWLLRKRREVRRRKAGRCVRCNYDLWGTPEKCPECGLAVKGKLGAVQQAVAG
jgi:hypothetical protein